MSGENVAYNLRPNKFVERQLFVELLEILCKERKDRYVYVSMGGAYLEDHRLLHNRLGLIHLISLESSKLVYQRQLFNLRPSYIQCLNSSTGEFINDRFDSLADTHSDKVFIVWLDYAKANQRYTQLMEFQALLGKMQIGEIIKITMNANPLTLGDQRRDESPEDVQKLRLAKLNSQIGKFIEGFEVLPDQMSSNGIIPILCHAVMKAAINAVKDNPRIEVLPLSIFVYHDGYHQMLTVTVTQVQKSEIDKFRKNIAQHWAYLPQDWYDFTRINVPNLTPKERLYIEGKLFLDDIHTMHDNLEFRLDDDEQKSVQILEEYARHYRRYPSYFQVIF